MSKTGTRLEYLHYFFTVFPFPNTFNGTTFNGSLLMEAKLFHDGGRYHIETWFLYDNGLRHERVR